MLDTDDVTPKLVALKVLVIDNDEALDRPLVEMLEHAGLQAALATTGADALKLKQEFQPDVVLADVNLPGTDGLALLTLLARQGDCGVIVVSAMTDDADRILGLELGADDYVCKPPHLRELLARIRAVHRRVKLRAVVPPDSFGDQLVALGSMKLDLAARTVTAAHGTQVKLTGAECSALETMLAANGVAVSRDTLCQAALHHPWRAEDRGVDQLIFSLRQKLADCEDKPLIHSIRGAGYMMSVAPAPMPVPHQDEAASSSC